MSKQGGDERPIRIIEGSVEDVVDITSITESDCSYDNCWFFVVLDVSRLFHGLFANSRT